MLDFNQLPKITAGKIIAVPQNLPVEYLLLDSRKIISPSSSVFFAIKGERHDGHRFLHELYEKGVRQFVVENAQAVNLPDANILQVHNSVKALQDIAAWHRSRFKIPVIGITGSNGKTIIKEWLSQLLSIDYNIVRSPRSYNSQIGVPLSVWQINEQHTLGIFEAGISLPNEMESLQKVIQPGIGIFTNIGPAHDEGFVNREEKVKEKLKLFAHSDILFYCKDYEVIEKNIPSHLKTFSWSAKKEADLSVKQVEKFNGKTKIQVNYQSETFYFTFNYSDDASIENILHCIAVLFYFKVDPVEIQTGSIRCIMLPCVLN